MTQHRRIASAVLMGALMLVSAPTSTYAQTHAAVSGERGSLELTNPVATVPMPPAHEETTSRIRRLRRAGWATTAIGGTMFVAGFARLLVPPCRNVVVCWEEDEFIPIIQGGILMGNGFAVATFVGLPLLIRARKLNRNTTRADKRELTVRPTTGGAVLVGTF
ncbi:MAG: hypothetical protein AAF500_14240 [Myxococcota bacterium]